MSLASKILYSTLCGVYEKILKARGKKKIDELRAFLDECRQKGAEMKKINQDAVRTNKLF